MTNKKIKISLLLSILLNNIKEDIIMVKEIKDDDFQKEVLEGDKTVVVDFWATWCQPCRMLAPVMEDVEKEMSEKVKFVKVNVDENPVSSATYSISNIPTVLVFKNAKIADKMVGFRPKNDIMQILEKHV